MTGVGFSRRSRFAANQYFLPQVKDGLHMLPSFQPLCKRTCVLRAHLVFLLLTGRHGFYSGGDGKVAGTWLVVWEGRRGAHGRSTGCQLAFSSPLRKVHRFTRWLHNNIISPFSIIGCSSAVCIYVWSFSFWVLCWMLPRDKDWSLRKKVKHVTR